MLAIAASTARLPFSAGFIMGLAGLAICMIGVPHGGLDHWKGRRWLQPVFGGLWAPVFFSGYLLVGCVVVAGWIWFPVLTVLGFFAVSAWHFGREDQDFRQPNASEPGSDIGESGSLALGLQHHLAAIALGGIAIWVPAIARPAEMQQILSVLIPENIPDASVAIVRVTTLASAVLVPCGIWFGLRQWRHPKRRAVIAATAATGLVAAVVPILCSFTIYFCGWHSIRGLQRLRREEGLGWNELAWRAAPLSLGAVVLMIAIAVSVDQPHLTLAGLSSNQQEIGLKMLFVGLSAIAVPHLFLHELCEVDDVFELSMGGVE